MTPLWRQNDVTASFWRHNYVIIASCVHWPGYVNADFVIERLDWSLFLRGQLMIGCHWFGLWLGTEQAISHYLIQWPSSMTAYVMGNVSSSALINTHPGHCTSQNFKMTYETFLCERNRPNIFLVAIGQIHFLIIFGDVCTLVPEADYVQNTNGVLSRGMDWYKWFLPILVDTYFMWAYIYCIIGITFPKVTTINILDQFIFITLLTPVSHLSWSTRYVACRGYSRHAWMIVACSQCGLHVWGENMAAPQQHWIRNVVCFGLLCVLTQVMSNFNCWL